MLHVYSRILYNSVSACNRQRKTVTMNAQGFDKGLVTARIGNAQQRRLLQSSPSAPAGPPVQVITPYSCFQFTRSSLFSLQAVPVCLLKQTV